MGDSFRPRAPYGDHDRHSENGDFHVGHQPRPPLRWPQQDRFRTSECDSYWSYAHPSNAPPSLNATRNHTSRNHSPTRNQSPHSRSEGGPRSGFTADDFNPDIQRSTLDLSSHISSSSLSQIQPPNSQSDLSPDGDPHFLDTSGSNHDASVSRLFTGSTTNAPREGAPPRWSNPDSETALAPAPTQEAGLKGKNLISMIRHAQEHSAPRDSKISGNDDFVSFDDDSRSRHDGDTDQGFIRQIESLDDLFSDRVLFTGRAIRRGNHAGSKPPQTRNRDFSPPRIPKAWSRERQRESARPGQKRKRSDSPEDADDIVSKWQGNDVPWLDTSVYNDRRHTAVEALNREILDFYSYARPRLFEYDMRRDVIRRLEGFLRQRLKGMEIKSFGSFASGLYLPNADMDFVALTEEYQKCRPNDFKPPFGKKALNTLTGQLRSDAARQQHPSVAKAGSVIAITKARVPLVKYVDAVSGIRVDLSFNNSSGLPAIDICNQWKADIPTLETYVLLVKHLLAMRGLNEVYCGGLGGFSTTCLVYVFLKCLPVDQALDPVKDFGETLMCLLDYYGNRFDISRSGVQTNPPGYFRKVWQIFRLRNTNIFSRRSKQQFHCGVMNIGGLHLCGLSKNALLL